MLGHSPGAPEDRRVPPVVGSGGSGLLPQQLLPGVSRAGWVLDLICQGCFLGENLVVPGVPSGAVLPSAQPHDAEEQSAAVPQCQLPPEPSRGGQGDRIPLL